MNKLYSKEEDKSVPRSESGVSIVITPADDIDEGDEDDIGKISHDDTSSVEDEMYTPEESTHEDLKADETVFVFQDMEQEETPITQTIQVIESKELSQETVNVKPELEKMFKETDDRSVDDSNREKTPLSLYTTHLDDQFVTSIEVASLPTVEGIHPSDVPQVISDKMIDEHTAGPPEIQPWDAVSTPHEHEEVKKQMSLPSGDSDINKDLHVTFPEKESYMEEQPLGEELIISQEWQTLIALLKRRQNLREQPSSVTPTATLMLLPSTQSSGEEKGEQVDANIGMLKLAIEKKEVVVVQKVIISIVETISTWLETIEYRIYTIRKNEDPNERIRQYENLRTELFIVEEKLTVLENVTQSAVTVLSEETIITIIETVKYLRQQVNHIEKVRQNEQDDLAQMEERYAQYLTAVSDAEQEVSRLKNQLGEIQETQMSPEEKLTKLEFLLTTNEETRDCITQLLLSSHDLRDIPSQKVGDELATIQAELCDVHDAVEKELDHHLRLTTSTTEYEETLMELTYLIEMAETILEARIVARDHGHLIDTITKHKKLFLSLRQCQKVLESLDTALEPSSRVHYQQLYSRSYLRASRLLDKATQRNHQLSLLEAEWVRLLNQLEEEEAWTVSASEQVTQLQTVSADTYEDNTNACKDLLVESVTHEAHVGHLVEMVRKVGDSITCTHLETRVTTHHQRTTRLRQEVSRLLERLEELHVHWSTYQTQMDKLQEWCSQAKTSLENIDLTPQDQEKLKEQFNQIWNLKAQFDSQSVLLNECMNHFDKSVGLVNMTDETHQRHFLSQFKSEWGELEELLQQKEKELHRIQIQVVPVPQLLAETQDTLSNIEVALQNIDTNVTSIQQLRDISENYKVLRIKILNSKENLEHLTQVSSIEEEQDDEVLDTLGQLSLTCQELICTIQQRIASLEYTLDHVQKTVSRVERISLTVDHLENTLERCQAVDKEGEQILKAALHSCQTIYDSLARTEEDITKVKQCMETLSQDPHHPCHLAELTLQVSALQERLELVAESIKETQTNLKNRLDMWQKFMSSSDAVDGFLQEVEYLLESALDLPSVNRAALKKHVEELQNLQGSMTTNKNLLEILKSQAVKVEKTHCMETQLTRWNSVSEKLESVILRYETALELWSRFVTVQEEVRVWVESKLTLIVSLQSRGISNEERSQIQVSTVLVFLFYW
nr:muscle-specific protein 300 kDa-like [Cherax quadricarinatus]